MAQFLLSLHEVMFIAHISEVPWSVIIIPLKMKTDKKKCISECTLHYGFGIGEVFSQLFMCSKY